MSKGKWGDISINWCYKHLKINENLWTISEKSSTSWKYWNPIFLVLEHFSIVQITVP